MTGDHVPEVHIVTPVDHRNVDGNERPCRRAIGKDNGVGQKVAVLRFVADKGAPAPTIGALRRYVDGVSARLAFSVSTISRSLNAVLSADPLA